MAQKSKKKTASRADKEVTSVKKKSAAKKAAEEKKNQEKSQKELRWASNTTVALIFLSLFIAYLVVAVSPDDGKLIQVSRSIIYGLVGQLGFYISIPSLLSQS